MAPSATIPMTPDEIAILVVLERLGGCLSLFATLLIFLAYGVYKRLRTVQNTFIIFASFANVGASIPSIIAYSGMHAGEASALCQAQGFLFEMFVQSDPWWALAMAINVFAVFFLGTSPATFHKWGWVYCIVCYGGPFLIALVLLFLRAPGRTLVYGSAGLWCWVSNDWNNLRIYTYYMLIWICVAGSMAVYIAIGYHVFQSRNRLENFRFTSSYARTTYDDERSAGANSGTAYATKVTEIRVTNSFDVAGLLSQVENPNRAHLPPRHGQPDWTANANPYRLGSSPPHRADPLVSTLITSESQNLSPQKRTKPAWRRFTKWLRVTRNKFKVEDQVKAAYLRTSLLFAVSVMVTWIPSSINRIRGLSHNDNPFGYNVATATVLPLQGVWNAVIFFVTSWVTLRECLLQTRDSWGARRQKKNVQNRPSRDIERGLPAMRFDDNGRYGYESDNYVTKVGGLQSDESTGGLGHQERKDSWEFMVVGRQGSDVELRRVSNGT